MKKITNPKPNPPRPKCVEINENFSLKQETKLEKNEAARATSYVRDNSLDGIHTMNDNNTYQPYDNYAWISYPHKCPKCGGDQEYNCMMVLTSYPAQYEVRCKKCGNISYSGSYTIKVNDPDLPDSLITPPDPGLPGYPSPGLPSYPNQPEKPSYGGSYGWICPKCGKVWAPHVNFCDCGGNNYNWNKFTCGTGTAVPSYKGPTTISHMDEVKVKPLTFVGDTIVGSGGTNEALSTMHVCDKNSITAGLNMPEFDKQNSNSKVETYNTLEVK